MANTVLWNNRPTAEELIGFNGTLVDLANDDTAVSDECTNGTGLYTWGDFLLYASGFADIPTAGGYFELHIVYEFGTTYGDGEAGDMGDANLSGNTLAAVFPINAVNESQYVQVVGLPLRPHDFKAAIVNETGQSLNDGTLNVFRYTEAIT